MNNEEINQLSDDIDKAISQFDWDADFERMIQKYEGI